ncbi:hypothetical protein CRG98_028038, partial [Punica granatum]
MPLDPGDSTALDLRVVNMDHSFFRGIIGDMVMFTETPVDWIFLRTATEFWDPEHAVFNFQGTELAPTIKEYTALIQRPTPTTQGIFVPNPFATIRSQLSNYVREVRRSRIRGPPHLRQIWLFAHVRSFCSTHPFSYIADERTLIERLPFGEHAHIPQSGNQTTRRPTGHSRRGGPPTFPHPNGPTLHPRPPQDSYRFGRSAANGTLAPYSVCTSLSTPPTKSEHSPPHRHNWSGSTRRDRHHHNGLRPPRLPELHLPPLPKPKAPSGRNEIGSVASLLIPAQRGPNRASSSSTPPPGQGPTIDPTPRVPPTQAPKNMEPISATTGPHGRPSPTGDVPVLGAGPARASSYLYTGPSDGLHSTSADGFPGAQCARSDSSSSHGASSIPAFITPRRPLLLGTAPYKHHLPRTRHADSCSPVRLTDAFLPRGRCRAGTLFPGMRLPPKFKVPEFKTYESTTDPRHHLQYWEYEEFVIYSFQDSLSGLALDWFMSLKAKDIPTWEDLSRKFIDQYRYCAETPPTLLELSTKEMEQGQRFEEYATKWRAQAAKHISPISEMQQIQLFQSTLKGVYYSHLLAHTSSFSDLIEPQPIYYSAPPVPPPATSQSYDHYAPATTQPSQPRPPVSRAPPSAQQNPTAQGPQAGSTQSRPRKQYTPLPSPLSHIYRQLLAGNQSQPISPGPNFDPSTQDQSKHCEYHQGVPRHTLDNCWRLRDEIQRRIDGNRLTFNAVRPPNVQANPLPNHRPSSGPSINMIAVEPTVEFTGHVPSSAPFVVDIPAREPYSDSKVPWTYEGSVESVEQQFSVMGVTRSGRVYENSAAKDKGKAPAAKVGAALESSPFPSKKVTEEEVEAFMKIVKASEYKVVDQMAKSPAHFSLLALLLGSEPHREALLRVLTSAQVLDISNAFSLLLGRPWIHSAGAVPSSLHQRLKFIVEEKLITVKGEEDYAIYKETTVPYISVGDDENLPFHSFETIFVIRDYRESGPSRADRMIGKEEVVKQINTGLLEVCNYSEWVANIVLVEKKDGRVRVCVDYRDLNKASPKDNFPLPHIDVLVDNTARHAQFSFMDGFCGYNQIRMVEKDKLKTTFTTMWGTFCYRVMPFGLKNAGATYQRAMVTLFHDMLHKQVEVYVDDMIAKSKEGEDHLVNLKRLFDRLREYKLRLNPAKCTFGARSGKLLGFMVSEHGIEVDTDKVKAIKELPPPSTVREVRGFLGRLNYIARFIANLTDKCQPLFRLLRKNAAMEWDHESQKAFDTIKAYLIRPPILVPPVPNRPLILYLTVSRQSLGCMLGQEDESTRTERAIYYLSKKFTEGESNYPKIEKMCCVLVDEEKEEPTWKMYFDGAVNSVESGVGAVLISPDGRHYPVATKIKALPNELHSMTAPWPFSMWGMDVIGPINPKASNRHMFILVAIDYFTKWIEAITLASVTAKAVARFLRRDVIARYG